MDTIKHARLYWVSRMGTMYVTDVPSPYTIVMVYAMCPFCVNDERNCEIDTIDYENKTFSCRELGRKDSRRTHKIPASALQTGGDGSHLVRVLDQSVKYIGRERTHVG